jgi:hypothetical protein
MSRILETPQIEFSNGSTTTCDMNTLRRLPVQKAIKLNRGKWVIAYDKNRLFQDADKVYNGLVEAAGKLEMSCEEPEWFELDREDNITLFSDLLENYVK